QKFELLLIRLVEQLPRASTSLIKDAKALFDELNAWKARSLVEPHNRFWNHRSASAFRRRRMESICSVEEVRRELQETLPLRFAHGRPNGKLAAYIGESGRRSLGRGAGRSASCATR